VLITRRSSFTGKSNTMDLPVTPEQIAEFESGGGYTQTIFPDLTPGQREFLISGVTPQEWDEFVGKNRRNKTC
jgi:hypothetical protein